MQKRIRFFIISALLVLIFLYVFKGAFLKEESPFSLYEISGKITIRENIENKNETIWSNSEVDHLPGYAYFTQHKYPKIFDLRAQGNLDIANAYVQKNTNHCLSLLTEGRFTDELRDCLAFWLLTSPKDESIPEFFYREYLEEEGESGSGEVRIKNWIWWEASKDALFTYLGTNKLREKYGDKYLRSFGNLFLDGKLEKTNNTCEEEDKSLCPYFHFIRKGDGAVFLGIENEGILSWLDWPSYLNAYLNPVPKAKADCGESTFYDCKRRRDRAIDSKDLEELVFPLRVGYFSFWEQSDGIFSFSWMKKGFLDEKVP